MDHQKNGNRQTRQILDYLHRRIKSAGYGWVTRVEQGLGVRSGWLRRRRWSGTIELSKLLDVLDVLDLDPTRFLQEALGTSTVGGHRPAGKPPELVQLVRQRLASGAAGDIGRGYLDELDRLRYDDPRRVIERTRDIVGHVELALLPRLLGVAGSAWRLLVDLDAAEHAIRTGLELADELADYAAAGDLLQRLSYVQADRGEHVEALQTAKEATLSYVQAGDLVGMGKAFVDQGIWLFYLDQPRQAIVAQETALRYLPESEHRNRFSALQGLGLYYHRLNDLEKAQRYADLARTEAADVPPALLGKLAWLQGSIRAELGRHAEAEQYFVEVLGIFRRLHYGETALASTELVRVQLLQGRSGDAYQTAKTMLRLVEPLRKNKIISAAIADLLRCGSAGLNLSLVDSVRAAMQKARGHQSWRSLDVK